MLIILLMCLCSFLCLVTAQKFAKACPKGLRGLPDGHRMVFKGRIILIGSMMLVAMNSAVVAIIGSFLVHHPEHRGLIPFALSSLIPVWLSFKAVFTVKDGSQDGPP